MVLINMKIRRSPTRTVAILHHAWKALEYQWSAENMGSGIQKWTPDTAQDMANVLDDIASLLGEFEEHRAKEVEEENIIRQDTNRTNLLLSVKESQRERDKKIYQLYLKGLSQQAIGREVGLAQARVSIILRKKFGNLINSRKLVNTRENVVL